MQGSKDSPRVWLVVQEIVRILLHMKAHTLSLIISELPLQNVELGLGIGNILLIQVVVPGILKAVGLQESVFFVNRRFN